MTASSTHHVQSEVNFQKENEAKEESGIQLPLPQGQSRRPQYKCQCSPCRLPTATRFALPTSTPNLALTSTTTQLQFRPQPQLSRREICLVETAARAKLEKRKNKPNLDREMKRFMPRRDATMPQGRFCCEYGRMAVPTSPTRIASAVLYVLNYTQQLSMWYTMCGIRGLVYEIYENSV